MNCKYLLDTNVVIRLFAGEEPVQDRFEESQDVFLSTVVLGELYYGAYKSHRTSENLAQIDDLAASTTVLECIAATARQYGAIRNELRLKGRPIPENDIWLAAIARQHGLRLVSGDAHFAEVGGVTLESW